MSRVFFPRHGADRAAAAHPGHEANRPHGMAASPADSGYWNFLCGLWAFYMFAVFTIGRYPGWTRTVIWGGALVLGLFTAFGLLRDRQSPPREAWILWAFAGWCLTGVLFIVNLSDFLRGIQMVIELAIIATLLGMVVRNAPSIKWLYLAFIGSVLFNVLFGLETLHLQAFNPDLPEARLRSVGLMENANALGFFCFIGVLAVMGLWGEIRSSAGRLALLVFVPPALYGMIVSGSRGAFVIFMVALFLWPTLCLRSLLRSRHLAVLAAVGVIMLGAMFGEWVVGGTYLGQRLTDALRFQEESSWVRLQLFESAVRVALAHPVTGIGLGQFQSVNEFGLNSHDEWGDLLSSTGFVGFTLFICVYVSVWRRLGRELRCAEDPVLRYRLNFARLTLIVLVIAGMLFRSNFMTVDSMLLLAMVIGVADWAGRRAKLSASFARAEMQGCPLAGSRSCVPIRWMADAARNNRNHPKLTV